MNKRCAAIVLFATATCATLSHAEFSLPWSNSLNIRVESMAGAALGIEDESTELNLLNIGNPVGLVFSKKQNRLDLAAGYDRVLVIKDNYPFDLFEKQMENINFTLLDPMGEFKGITYWITEDLVLQANATGQKGRESTTHMDGNQDIFSTTWASGGIRGAYSFGPLAFGGDFQYSKAINKGETLHPDLYTDYLVDANNIKWGISAAYRDKIISDIERFTIGLSVGSLDKKPYNLTLLQNNSQGDYNISNSITYTPIDIIGVDPGTGLPVVVGQSVLHLDSEIIVRPLSMTGQILCEIESYFQAALLFDYRTREYKKHDKMISTSGLPYFNETTENIGAQLEYSLSPQIKLDIPLDDETNALFSLFFTPLGISRVTDYQFAQNDPYYLGESVLDSGLYALALGAGLQAFKKQLQIGLQYERTNDINTRSYPEVNGTALNDKKFVRSSTEYRAGIEYRPFSVLSIRGGYSWSNYESPDEAECILGEYVYRLTTRRMTMGFGIVFDESLKFDVLGGYSVNDPEPLSVVPVKGDTAIDMVIEMHMAI